MIVDPPAEERPAIYQHNLPVCIADSTGLSSERKGKGEGREERKGKGKKKGEKAEEGTGRGVGGE